MGRVNPLKNRKFIPIGCWRIAMDYHCGMDGPPKKKDTSVGPSLHPEGLHGMSLNRSDQHLHRPSIHDPPIHNLTSLSPIYQAAHSVRKSSTIFTRYISRFSLTTNHHLLTAALSASIFVSKRFLSLLCTATCVGHRIDAVQLTMVGHSEFSCLRLVRCYIPL